MNVDTRERIERLRALECAATYYQVCEAYLGKETEYALKVHNFRYMLIDLLERSDPDGWTDEQLSKYGLIRLPRDRDGEFIRIEDDVFDDDGRPCVVTGVWVTGDGISLVTCASEGRGTNRAPQTLTHHPPVTVESVLREFGDKYIQVVESPNPIVGFGNEIIGEEDPEKTIAEYAKRLRLAKEDE